jgi:CBS domain-containing protein
VFVVVPPLNPGDPEALQLFRARRDLITIIERDLDDTQRGVIFLVGQRRMGKTSLLAMLPTYLGTATTIVTCDFQGLSGSEHGRAPHRWVVQELAAALARIPGLTLPTPNVTDAWGSALSWLSAVDAELARVDHRALVAIDEVERLQDAANEGWGNLTFLDFVRAAGDKLRRIRLLLVSAHPLANPKLGRAWVDRLISVLPRTLGPLDPDDAEALLCRPVPTFPPDVFDEAAARTILAQTGRHPFLIQAVGKELVQRLLKDRRRAATAHDVERALDGVVKIAESALFTYLWDAFEPAERDIMRALAGGAAVDHETGTFRVLREQWFVDMHDGDPVVAFPLFARWIRDYRGEQPAA